MKKYLSFILALVFAVSLLASCDNRDNEGASSMPSESTSDESSVHTSDESRDAVQKEWSYSQLASLDYGSAKYGTENSFFTVWYKQDDAYIKYLCHENEYLASTVVNEPARGAKNEPRFTYFGLETLKYTIEVKGSDGFTYKAYVGLIPDRFRGKNAEELLRDASDYYECFDMKSGSIRIADHTADFVYREKSDDASACAVAVFGTKWFVAVRPAYSGGGEGLHPEAIFGDILFDVRKFTNSYVRMISNANRYDSGVVVLKTLVGGYDRLNMEYSYSIYDENGDKKNEFEAYTYYQVDFDKTARLWSRSEFTEEGYKQYYCNKYGEDIPLNQATYVVPYDKEKGDILGIIDGNVFVFDGDGKKEPLTEKYTSVKTLGGTEAVKFNDSVYALIQNGRFVRLYETDFAHESAALEYSEEYDAIFVGGDAITEIVNRHGEIVEAFWYNAHNTDPFTEDTSGKYLLTEDTMSLAGNTYILDSDTFKPLAHLPGNGYYEFTRDGRLRVCYTDLDSGEEYEFTVSIESAIKSYPYDKETHDSNCNCFWGYPTEDSFK
ncbi:MAG: hypothetical protein IKK70_02560 [Clostridia bacterium]|nr:hypothetical protein [Clostridia bacterium]